MDFSETIADREQKIGTSRRQIEFGEGIYMYVTVYERSRSFLDLDPKSLHAHMKIKTCFKNQLCQFLPNFVSFKVHGNCNFFQ